MIFDLSGSHNLPLLGLVSWTCTVEASEAFYGRGGFASFWFLLAVYFDHMAHLGGGVGRFSRMWNFCSCVGVSLAEAHLISSNYYFVRTRLKKRFLIHGNAGADDRRGMDRILTT